MHLVAVNKPSIVISAHEEILMLGFEEGRAVS